MPAVEETLKEVARKPKNKLKSFVACWTWILYSVRIGVTAAKTLSLRHSNTKL